MTTIEPIRKDLEHPGQIKKHSFPLRLWHWANMIVICGSLITVLLNSTLTSQGNTSRLIKNELQNSGVIANDDQIHSAAHAISDKTWEIHTYFGYALAALLLFRLLLEFFRLADQKFIRGIKNAYAQLKSTKKSRELVRHELTVKLIYAVFYCLLIIMALTGLTLAFEDSMAFLKPVRHSVKEVHGFCMYLILGFITVHLAGVLLAERKDGKGIVSDMINGGTEDL